MSAFLQHHGRHWHAHGARIWHLSVCLILGLAAGFGLSVRVRAATEAPPAPVMFTTMAWDVIDPSGDLTLNFQAGGKPRQAVVTWRDRSLPQLCDGPGPLVFTHTVERDGRRIEQPVASVHIPVGMTRVLLVFGKNRNPAPGDPAIRIMVIDDSYTVFPGQSVRFLNYSRMELGGLLGDRPFAVPPGGEQVVPAALPQKNRLLPFKLAKRDETSGWTKLRSTGLPMTEGLRVLVFLIEDSRTPGRAELVLLRDREAAAPPAPAGARPDR